MSFLKEVKGISGQGPVAKAVLKASKQLDSFSPALNAELTKASEAVAFYGNENSASDQFGEALVVSISATVDDGLGQRRGDGRVWYLGGRGCSRAQRDYARSHQRLLPSYELGLVKAAQAAAYEAGKHPVFLSLNLDVLTPSIAPAVAFPYPGGASLGELWEAALAFRSKVVAFEILGMEPKKDLNQRTAALVAQLLRDLSLLYFGDGT